MRRIILASQSKARQKLLKQIGLRFRVVKSAFKERRHFSTNKKSASGSIQLNNVRLVAMNKKVEDRCAVLVMENALGKARETARNFDKGIVIAADTVVLSGRKIIGKPKDTKEAFKILKLLSEKPQWVYTGLALIDIDRGEALLDYEKTKIYMHPLSDEQINSYFKKVSVRNMAGSFDIQGLGGIFINRIEGCFYNVVGLPLAKLARMLEKLGVKL